MCSSDLALPVILEKETTELFTRYKVYTERELQSRYTILCENYVKTVTIEAKCVALIARTMILPAALRYQGEVAGTVNATKAAGVECGAQQELLKGLAEVVTGFQKAIHQLDHALDHSGGSEPIDHCRHGRDAVLPAMLEVRKLGDKLETLVADDLWPLPTYREMLFIK